MQSQVPPPQKSPFEKNTKQILAWLLIAAIVIFTALSLWAVWTQQPIVASGLSVIAVGISLLLALLTVSPKILFYLRPSWGIGMIYIVLICSLLLNALQFYQKNQSEIQFSTQLKNFQIQHSEKQRGILGYYKNQISVYKRKNLDSPPTDHPDRTIIQYEVYDAFKKLDIPYRTEFLRYLLDTRLVWGNKKAGPIIALRYLDLRSVNFTGMEILNVDLSYSDLRDSNFQDAEIKGANLTGVKLNRTSITSSQLSQAWLLRGATLPNGVVCEMIKDVGDSRQATINQDCLKKYRS